GARSPARDDPPGTGPGMPAGATRSGLTRPKTDGPPALAGETPSRSAAPTVITSGNPATPSTDCGAGPRSPAGATTTIPALPSSAVFSRSLAHPPASPAAVRSEALAAPGSAGPACAP